MAEKFFCITNILRSEKWSDLFCIINILFLMSLHLCKVLLLLWSIKIILIYNVQ